MLYNKQQSDKSVELKGINLTYNKGKSNAFKALSEIDLTIKQGEFVVVFGPSGCGKSSLLNIIAGLEDPDSGEIAVGGMKISDLTEEKKAQFYRRKMGMVFQAYNLIPTLSVLDNVTLPQVFVSSSERARKQKALEILARFGVAEHKDKLPVELSGGQQQRIGIARAIINEPNLILADEPIGNLDSKSANIVMGILGELNRQEKKTVVMVSHNPENIVWGTHIVRMKDGKIVKEEYKSATGMVEATKKGTEANKSSFAKLKERFQGLSKEHLAFLLRPLKTQLIAESLVLPFGEKRMKKLEELIELRLGRKIDQETLLKLLDSDLEQGGMGLDYRTAQKFNQQIESLIAEASQIASCQELEQKVLKITSFLYRKTQLAVLKSNFAVFAKVLQGKLEEKLDDAEFRQFLDRPLSAGGIGLDKRNIDKLERLLDLILIISYGLEWEMEEARLRSNKKIAPEKPA